MKKKMLIWIGALALATVAVACSKKNAGTTPVENKGEAAAPAGGDAYGGAAYGTPAPEAAPAPEPAPQK